jgi:ABC-type multidrug transport system permease subunit
MQNIYLTLTFGIIFFLPNFILNSILFFITFYYSSSIEPMEFGLFKESNEFKIISSVTNVTGWILSIFYWYILSCFIVWIYDRSKSREVKKK